MLSCLIACMWEVRVAMCVSRTLVRVIGEGGGVGVVRKDGSGPTSPDILDDDSVENLM